jgi:hypothetical protein
MRTFRHPKFDHTGSSFDSFLEEEGIIEEVEAKARQRLLDIAAQADAEEGIRQGLDDVRKGKLRHAREFFAEFETTHGLSR